MSLQMEGRMCFSQHKALSCLWFELFMTAQTKKPQGAFIEN